MLWATRSVSDLKIAHFFFFRDLQGQNTAEIERRVAAVWQRRKYSFRFKSENRFFFFQEPLGQNAAAIERRVAAIWHRREYREVARIRHVT